jgi:tRNA G18 (ribose-2'-O)-methylase SpoU
LFVAEGRFVVERLLTRPHYQTHSILVTPTAHAALLQTAAAAALARIPVYVAEQAVLDEIVGLHIHRGCLALAARPAAEILDPGALTRLSRVVVLEGVNNPDNVGGIFRSAAAFDVELIVLGPGCGDPLYRKAIRTSMAATLDVPYVSSGDWPHALDVMKEAGMRVWALTPDASGAALEAIAVPERVALLCGTEGAGLSGPALERADVSVHIRMSGRVDSLNVTVAASIAMHHCFARRR